MNEKSERTVPGQYVTIRQAADFLHVSPATIKRWLTQKKFRRYKLRSGAKSAAGARTLLSAKEVESFIVEV